MKLGVIGLGKLGLPLAALLAENNHVVYCFDKSKELISQLISKKYKSNEPYLMDMLERNCDRLSFDTEMKNLVQSAEIIFIIVPTPSEATGHFSNEYLVDVMDQLGEHLRDNKSKVVINVVSTVMPGACESVLIPALENSSLKRVGDQIGFCYNPEFIALGSVIENMRYPDMHLLGESDHWAGDLVEQVLRSIVTNQVPAMRMNLREAELVKISVNNFVTMKISYANNLYQASEKLGNVNIDVVTNAIGLDSRIGRKYLKGAAPYGGPCFPRDTRALDALYKDLGIENALSYSTDYSNKAHIKFLASMVAESAGKGKIIGVAGISYKIGTPVTEESPGLAIAQELVNSGYQVVVWDDEGAFPNDPKFRLCNLDEFINLSDFILISRPISNKDLFAALADNEMPYLDLWRQE